MPSRLGEMVVVTFFLEQRQQGRQSGAHGAHDFDSIR
jgi:hypothetical protein